MGEIVDLDDIAVTEKYSFHIETKPGKPIDVLEGHTGDVDVFVSIQAGEIDINLRETALKKTVTSNANDVCLTDNANFYFTDCNNQSIGRFSMDAFYNVPIQLSASLNTAPLIPYGICQSTFYHITVGLLVSLMDDESEKINQTHTAGV